jgi:hypothetical protein
MIFDAIGRVAIGQVPSSGSVVMAAATGTFAFTGNAATFAISEAASTGAFNLTGITASFSVGWPETAGAFTFTGKAATFTISEAAASGAFALTGQPANETILWPDAPASFVFTGNPANLVRTGDNYEFKLGGVGHYKLELERAKQLAAITRKAPGPIDLRTKPQFQPLASPYSAPSSPSLDAAAILKQRMDAQMAAAKAAKKRRDAEAILLLAS